MDFIETCSVCSIYVYVEIDIDRKWLQNVSISSFLKYRRLQKKRKLGCKPYFSTFQFMILAKIPQCLYNLFIFVSKVVKVISSFLNGHIRTLIGMLLPYINV